MTKMDNKFISPRMQGTYEQYRRARHFVQLAHRCKNPVSKFTNLIAAVYSARAIAELMIEAVKKQELPSLKNREEVENAIIPKLPYYKLIYRIRIHDFHRFGCLPPSPKCKTAFYGGPITFNVKKGRSSIQGERQLFTRNGIYFGIDNKKLVPLDKILDDFLSAVPEVITEFKSYYHRK